MTNLKYIKRWYEFYAQDKANRQQPVDDFDMPKEFALVSWSLHIKIFTKCKNIHEAMFYIHKTIEGNWSRAVQDAKEIVIDPKVVHSSREQHKDEKADACFCYRPVNG